MLKDITVELLVSTFNDGVNNIYHKLTLDRWYDARFGDYVFTFNGEVEYLASSGNINTLLNNVYGSSLLDYKLIQ